MTQVATPQGKPSHRKLLLQALAGAVCGGVGMYLGMTFIERGAPSAPDVVVGFGVALIYFLTGTLVGLGALAPRFGAHALNVEDMNEVIEERRNLIGAALIFLAIAALLLGLTLAPGGAGLLGRSTATMLVAGAFTMLVAGSWYYRNLGDEMMRAASKDASVITVYLLFLLFGGWAMLAQLGLAESFTPLLFVGGFFAVYLLAVYVAVARRGLLKPR
jgi:hypothetical protein